MYFNSIIIPTGSSGSVDTGTGWAQYADTEYTSANPLVIPVGPAVRLPNNALSTITAHLPDDITAFYDGTTGKILGNNEGDTITLRVSFKCFTDNNNGFAEVTVDIGGTIGSILDLPINFPRGTGSINARPYTSTNLLYTLDTFVQNGGELLIESIRGTTSIYDIVYVIERTHKAI